MTGGIEEGWFAPQRTSFRLMTRAIHALVLLGMHGAVGFVPLSRNLTDGRLESIKIDSFSRDY